MLKKILFLSLACFMCLTTIPTEAALTSTALPTFTGLKSTENIAFQYQDIAGHWGQKSILRVCAVSLMQGQSQNAFAPQKNATYAETVISSVRLKGLEAAAQSEAEKLAQTTIYPIASTAEAKLLEGYLNIARKNGILTDAEFEMISALSNEATVAVTTEANILITNALNQGALAPNQSNQARQEITAALQQNRAWNAPVSRQLALTWVARSADLKPVYGVDQQNIYRLKDWKSINPDQLPLLEAALQNGIISGSSQGYFNPNAMITRGEFASILDRAFSLKAAKLNYTVQTGVITKIEYVYATSAMNSGFNYDIELRLQNLDGTYVQIFVTTDHYSNAVTSGSFPVYQSGRFISPASLSQGSEVQYIITGETVVWMESR